MIDSKEKHRKGFWFNNVYVLNPKGLGVALANYLGLDSTNARLCCNLFHQLQMAFACTDFNHSLVFSVNRRRALLNTGFKDAAGNYVYMLMVRNKNGGPQPYIFQGKFCTEQDIDLREFSKIPGMRDIVVDPLKVIKLGEVKDIVIGSYHTIVEHAERVEQCLDSASYENMCNELELCIRASVTYAKHNSKVLELNVHKGRLQVVIPFLDREHRICSDLAVVLEYDPERQLLVVPTILKTAHVKQDRSCKWSRESHASWVDIYGSAA